MSTVKRFNEWTPALLAAIELGQETGVRFRVYRSPWPVYGWYWWQVEPVKAPAPRPRAATVAELQAFAQASTQARKARRTEAVR